MKEFTNISKIISLQILLFFSYTLQSQVQLPQYNNQEFSTYYLQKTSFAENLPLRQNEIVFLGNSITDGAEWGELFNDNKVVSRGISGDNTKGVIHRLPDIARRKPSKVFLLIGTNDLAAKIPADTVIKNILLIAGYLHEKSPSTSLYVQSILPVNDVFEKFPSHTGNNEVIEKINSSLQQNAPNHKYTFIDLHSYFSNGEGKLDTAYSNDGLHLTGHGYSLWKHLIFPFVYDLNEKPSLVPLPQKVNWNRRRFPLYRVKYVVAGAGLEKEAKWLQDKLLQNGREAEILQTPPANGRYIQLQLRKVDAPLLKEEAYTIEVDVNKAVVSANTTHGIFNGLQTLTQLMRDGEYVEGVSIHDWPAFSWRGFMVDVGRNFQSMEFLKQQIEKMAFYKLNIFHFHFTEDIAWRLMSDLYPQLTAPENMLRNKGQYYTKVEMQELISFCRDRYITLVPEIDMPGHSDAFTRAMGVDMQSDSGIIILKKILKEFVSTYKLPYFHIGADEVKITNKNFIPEITRFLEKEGKKSVGWQPGGNFLPSTIRQLWMGNDPVPDSGSIKYIDSRHLYLNHMDPLEAVVSIYNRQIGDAAAESSTMIGGTLCSWPDRRIAYEKDILKMDAIYPGMMAFAERAWLGGGQKQFISNVSDAVDKAAFANFEGRLLDHKELYFKNISFPYQKQSDVEWNLYGPYANNGNLAKSFEPEKGAFPAQPAEKATGGTIVLRHWWYPLINGAIDRAKENTTWYATTRIWSDEAGDVPFWIGFNDLSRSTATDSPPKGKWSYLDSKVWVNGKEIEPPHWKRAGEKGNSEIPLVDELYTLRNPTMISLKKGWNDVMIKAPVGKFAGKDWQNPVKWMFTFVKCL